MRSAHVGRGRERSLADAVAYDSSTTIVRVRLYVVASTDGPELGRDLCRQVTPRKPLPDEPIRVVSD